MSHVVCGKKAIDNYGALGSEAAAILAGNFDPFLNQEAAALLEATKAACDSWYQSHESFVKYDSDEPRDADAKAVIQLALNESYQACEWADDLRAERDALRKRKVGKHKNFESWALDLRKKRDHILKTFRKIADDELRRTGYSVPDDDEAALKRLMPSPEDES